MFFLRITRAGYCSSDVLGVYCGCTCVRIFAGTSDILNVRYSVMFSVSPGSLLDITLINSKQNFFTRHNNLSLQ
jgi:hypothetical protein